MGNHRAEIWDNPEQPLGGNNSWRAPQKLTKGLQKTEPRRSFFKSPAPHKITRRLRITEGMELFWASWGHGCAAYEEQA